MPTKPQDQKPKCFPRKRFGSQQAAQLACVHIAQTKKIQRYPEPCRFCDGWHLKWGFYEK